MARVGSRFKGLTKRWQFGVVAALFMLVGVAVLLRSFAATPATSLEAEAGSIVSPAAEQSNTNASGGKHLKFGSSANPLPLRASGNNDALPQTLKFQDEFNGTTLNTAYWKTGWFENANGISNAVQEQELQCYDKNMVSVSGGNLVLKSIVSDVVCDGRTKQIRAGAVTSRDKIIFDHGYFEARIRNSFDSAPGQLGWLWNWPAFWTAPNDEDMWPEHGELDILEGSGGTADSNWHGPVTQGPGKPIAEEEMTNDWHVYAANWNNNTVTSYFDGKKVGSSYTSIADVVHFMNCLNLMLQYNPNYPYKAPDEMLVDYVRVWQ